jgi:predicted nucleotidyltransferase
MTNETRWKQRFENLTETFNLLEEAPTAEELGSRAKGNAKHGSDIDLAIYGDTDHEGVKRHIDTEGREFFRRPSAGATGTGS